MSYNIYSVLLATTNPGKIKEIRSCFGNEIELKSLKDFGDIKEIEEDGQTFEENARKKALGYAKATGCLTIADDSGLVIDALGGAPGVKSARFSGDKQRNEERAIIDHRNIAKVLELLKDVSKDKRAARFVCCLCMASPDKILIEASGAMEGIIIDKEIGTNGFGYDPILYIPELQKTVAQLTQEEKNEISHRGKAIRELKKKINNLK